MHKLQQYRLQIWDGGWESNQLTAKQLTVCKSTAQSLLHNHFLLRDIFQTFAGCLSLFEMLSVSMGFPYGCANRQLDNFISITLIYFTTYLYHEYDLIEQYIHIPVYCLLIFLNNIITYCSITTQKSLYSHPINYFVHIGYSVMLYI